MLLTISNLSKAFGDNQVLSNVTLTMHRGDKWGLVGANGVGKSTLIKIIVGEVEPDAGATELADGHRSRLSAASAGGRRYTDRRRTGCPVAGTRACTSRLACDRWKPAWRKAVSWTT